MPVTDASLPQHVAIVMDGNGRWASKRHLPRLAGHRAGLSAAREAITLAVQRGIPVLSLFTFSSENWHRPEEEVTSLMNLFFNALESELPGLIERNVRLRIVGDPRGFSEKIQARIDRSQGKTQDNTGLQLNIIANYGGRWDILQAVQKLAARVAIGELQPEAIEANDFAQYLSLANLPEPDLFIRTSGEYRISNFFLWQLAYTELYFTETLWPDFKREQFEEALTAFSQRQRRFGGVEPRSKTPC